MFSPPSSFYSLSLVFCFFLSLISIFCLSVVPPIYVFLRRDMMIPAEKRRGLATKIQQYCVLVCEVLLTPPFFQC